MCDPYTQLYPPLRTVFMCALVTDLQGNTEINSTLVLLTVHSTLKQTFFCQKFKFSLLFGYNIKNVFIIKIDQKKI